MGRSHRNHQHQRAMVRVLLLLSFLAFTMAMMPGGDTSEFVHIPDAGYCASDWDESIDWNATEPHPASECWEACQDLAESSGNHSLVAADYGSNTHTMGDGTNVTETWCYCEDDCKCMHAIGETGTLLDYDDPLQFNLPVDCDDYDWDGEVELCKKSG